MAKNIEQIVEVDPLSVYLPTRVYLILVEIKHPHVPKVADIRRAVKALTPRERKAALSHLNTVEETAKLVRAELERAGG
ncbi:MAG TPA: hypothetical protein VGC93_03460 [Thermoanaerobaculia bacterium]